MNPIINVNLAGMRFVFNCDAYSLLSEYLNSLKKVFEMCGDEGESISSDIEGRCAELLIEKHDPAVYIVTADDVKEIIAILGEPEEILSISDLSRDKVEEESDKDNTTDPPAMPGVCKLKKRLFRTPDDKILGGVCGGIAAYFNIDPTYVRLAAVALSLLSGTVAIVVYIVLWIVIPPAVTPLQYLMLRGESPSINNIGKHVNSWFSARKAKNDVGGWQQEAYEEYADYSGVSSRKSGVGNIFIIIAGLFVIPVILLLLLGLILTGVVTFAAAFTDNTMLMEGLMRGSDQMLAWAPVFQLFNICLTIVVTVMPLIALTYTALRRLSGGRPMKHKNVIAYWMSWLLCLIVNLVSWIVIFLNVNP